MSDPAQRSAHYAVSRAIQAGVLIRPPACEQCGAISRVDGAHYNYDEKLRVRWLCRPCHRTWDDIPGRIREGWRQHKAEFGPPQLPRPNFQTVKLTRLRAWRIRRALSQGELADLVGITQAALSRIERGLAEPRYVTIRKLAQILDCAPEQLMDPASLSDTEP